jgi:hypothetical protein
MAPKRRRFTKINTTYVQFYAFVINKKKKKHLLETSNYFHCAIEVRHVPARKGNSQDAREHRLAILVRRLRYDEMRHPRANLQHVLPEFCFYMMLILNFGQQVEQFPSKT